MTTFLIGAAALLIIVLLFLLPPLLRGNVNGESEVLAHDANLAILRDQLHELDADRERGLITTAAYESARDELRRRVDEDTRPVLPARGHAARWTTPLVLLILPVAAMFLYVMLGTPDALTPAALSVHDPSGMEEAVRNLAHRLESQPDDAEGWETLARSYNALERYDDALKAYAYLARLRPNDANILADYADTMAMVRNGSLQGEPERLVERSLAIDPNNLKSLALSGTAAFERGDYPDAIAQWERIQRLAPPESDVARATADSIRDAKRMMQAKKETPTTVATIPPRKKSDVPSSSSSVRGVVDLDPALRDRVAANDTVFIFARAVGGATDRPSMPVAVIRTTVAALPYQFVLDDSATMNGQKLSELKEVLVGVRISRSGNALEREGEMSVLTGPIPVGEKNLTIRVGEK
jgi:cytochrome c-type biogenesis protein CcmH